MDFPGTGRWEETLFRAESAGAYSILQYLNGHPRRLRGLWVERPLTWREAARRAGRLSTMRIPAWQPARVEVRGVSRWRAEVIALAMEDPQWSRRGAMGQVLRYWEEEQIARLWSMCGGFRNREAMAGLGRLLETVWELGMRPAGIDALYRIADVPPDLAFSDLADVLVERMVEKVVGELGRGRRVGALELLDRYRPALSVEARVRVARELLKGEWRPQGGVRFVEWVLGAGEVMGRLGEGERAELAEWGRGARALVGAKGRAPVFRD